MQYQINPMIEVNVRRSVLKHLHILPDPGFPKTFMIGEEYHDDYEDIYEVTVNTQAELDQILDDEDSMMRGSPYYREV